MNDACFDFKLPPFVITVDELVKAVNNALFGCEDAQEAQAGFSFGGDEQQALGPVWGVRAADAPTALLRITPPGEEGRVKEGRGKSFAVSLMGGGGEPSSVMFDIDVSEKWPDAGLQCSLRGRIGTLGFDLEIVSLSKTRQRVLIHKADVFPGWSLPDGELVQCVAKTADRGGTGLGQTGAVRVYRATVRDAFGNPIPAQGEAKSP